VDSHLNEKQKAPLLKFDKGALLLGGDVAVQRLYVIVIARFNYFQKSNINDV